MRTLKYVVCQEGKYFVSQGLNLDVSSFGETIEEAIANLQEAVELYLEDEIDGANYQDIGLAVIGESQINA